MKETVWPPLSLDEWEATYRTLHRWTQVIGKIRLQLCSPVNHWWHCSLRFNARGLTTTLMPFKDRQVEIAFDFIAHQLQISTTDGVRRELILEPMSVADFYHAVRKEFAALGIEVRMWPMPVEVPNPVPFPEDHTNASYDREHVARMWTILSRVHDVFARSRGAFLGKMSPIHFFWGAFDVALTRFSGRRNPNPPSDPTMREAYSHEVISHGFWFGGDWPGGGRVSSPVFYAYAIPEPTGFAEARVKPTTAAYSKSFGEYLLPYDAVRQAADPASEILSFMDSTYEAGANLVRRVDFGLL